MSRFIPACLTALALMLPAAALADDDGHRHRRGERHDSGGGRFVFIWDDHGRGFPLLDGWRREHRRDHHHRAERWHKRHHRPHYRHEHRHHGHGRHYGRRHELPLSAILFRLNRHDYYGFRKIRRKGDRYVVMARDSYGDRVKLVVDAHDGHIIRSRRIR